MNAVATQQQQVTRKILTGASCALPVVMGYLPIGFAYGVLAQKSGVSAFNTVMMSLIVFAGSSQFIAVGLLASGASALSIVFTTFVVNLRHLLMSTSLSAHLKGWKKFELAVFAFHITDETFAVHSMRYAKNNPSKTEVFSINIISQASWVLGSCLGIVAGQLIKDVEPLGLDYALPAMFIGLLVLQIRNTTQVLIAVLAGLFSVGLFLSGLNQWNVIVATLIGATLGAIIEQWIKKPSS
jgi:4-azaleucine resistance transporter AzlC